MGFQIFITYLFVIEQTERDLTLCRTRLFANFIAYICLSLDKTDNAMKFESRMEIQFIEHRSISPQGYSKFVSGIWHLIDMASGRYLWQTFTCHHKDPLEAKSCIGLNVRKWWQGMKVDWETSQLFLPNSLIYNLVALVYYTDSIKDALDNAKKVSSDSINNMLFW